MMWDDEFRSFSEHQLLQSGIGSLVDIVVWNYQVNMQYILPSQSLYYISFFFIFT